MKKFFIRSFIIIFALCLLCGCVPQIQPSAPSTVPTNTEPVTTVATKPSTEPTVETTTAPSEPATVPSTEPSTDPSTEPPTTTPTTTEHSDLYIPGLPVEDVIRYFNEVCLNAEFINSGDPTKLQKWNTPIRYRCNGTYTSADKYMLDMFVDWLNTIEGFPGMQEAGENDDVNLQFYFCEEAEYIERMGDNFYGTDGGVTFWYNGADEIYNAIISYRTEVEQYIRNSVILEEIYNGLGPINDTALRPDSVIYTDYSTPQRLSDIDELILKLLYHPQMRCGMNAAACEAVIRQLYY